MSWLRPTRSYLSRSRTIRRRGPGGANCRYSISHRPTERSQPGFGSLSLEGFPTGRASTCGDDVLRLVVEALETPDAQRWVTVLETYRLSDPRSLSPSPVALLDRLELARGERLSSVRLDAGRGYIATFDPTDPVWMIDLSDPLNLRIAGEVSVPGGSTVLHPMGDRLLTLGVDQALGSRVAAQLFDVSDPFRPERLATVPVGEIAEWKAGGLEPRELGVFPEQGLVAVPGFKASPSIRERGVQLLELGRHTLSPRGFLKADGWVPERSILHRERLLTVSARSLVSADIGDRDEPRAASSLELAYAVDRVLVVGEHLLEFHKSTVRIRRLDGTGLWTAVDVGVLPVLGAEEKGGVVHLLQGRGAEVVWDYDAANSTWTGRTNRPGWLQASVWDASLLPSLIKVGEGGHPTALTWIGDAEGHWLRDHELLWSSTTELRSGWELGGPKGRAESVAMDGLAVVGGGPWQPWQGTRARHLTAVDVSNAASPRICSELLLGGNSGSVGAIAQAGSLIFSSRRRMESEVVGRQEVVDLAWYAWAPEMETTEVMDLRGQWRTDFWARNEAEWRSVPEGSPRVRWWTRHELDVVDYRAGLDRPVVRARRCRFRVSWKALRRMGRCCSRPHGACAKTEARLQPWMRVPTMASQPTGSTRFRLPTGRCRSLSPRSRCARAWWLWPGEDGVMRRNQDWRCGRWGTMANGAWVPGSIWGWFQANSNGWVTGCWPETAGKLPGFGWGPVPDWNHSL
jgi:hypothetical protein